MDIAQDVSLNLPRRIADAINRLKTTILRIQGISASITIAENSILDPDRAVGQIEIDKIDADRIIRAHRTGNDIIIITIDEISDTNVDAMLRIQPEGAEVVQIQAIINPSIGNIRPSTTSNRKEASSSPAVAGSCI